MGKGKLKVLIILLLDLSMFSVGCINNNGDCNGNNEVEVEIGLDTTGFTYSEEREAYVSEEEEVTVKGTIVNSFDLSSLSYRITDENGSILSSNNLSVASHFEIGGLLLMEGMNTIEIDGIKTNGEVVSKSIGIYYEKPVKVGFNMEVFPVLDEEKDWYAFVENENGLNGFVEGDVSKLSYLKLIVKDDHGLIIKVVELEKNNMWWTYDIGFMSEINELIIEGGLISGGIVSGSINVGAGRKYMDNLSIDQEDNDGDGLINYLEDYYETDKNMADTDGVC